MDQYPQPGNAGGNRYDFILNPEQPKRSRKLGLGGNNFILTIVLVISGAVVFMILVTVLLNAFAPEKISKEDLIGLAQSQTEMVRISTEGVASGVQQSTKDLASTIEYTMMTQRKQTIDVLSKNDVTLGSKELALKQNADTDQQFRSAKSTSTFDTTFTKIAEDELNRYAATLKRLSSVAATDAERDRMSDYYQQTQLLISQIPYTQDKIDSADQ